MKNHEIKWVGTDGDFFPKRMDCHGKIWKPEVHVFHIMQGSLGGTDTWFNSDKAQVSSGYGIGKKGEIHQYVKDVDAAFVNGFCSNPNWYGAKKYPGVNPNMYTIGYELEGMSGEVPTPDQWDALMWLVDAKTIEFNIPKTKDNFTGHYIIDPVNKSGCPGTGFPWVKLYDHFGILHDINISSMKVLAYGSKLSEDVKFLQITLKKLGYNLGVGGDGIFGPLTLAAVKDFQKKNGLVVDGIVASATWSKLIKR